MKNLCIIGDSWAGAIASHEGVFSRILGPAGFDVTNIAVAGASNQGQLRLLQYQYLEQGIKFDQVVWFYVEPVRDFTEFISLDYGDDTEAKNTTFAGLTYHDFYADLEYLARHNFEHAAKLAVTYDIPFLVIGGGGVIPRSFDFSPAIQILTRSWNQEIAGLETMPWNIFTHHVIMMADFAGTYNRQQILEELELLEKLESVMKNDAVRYEDTLHPSLHLYPALGDRIIQTLRDQKT